MRLIAVDFGNSSSKFALIDTADGKLADVHTLNNGQPVDSSQWGWLDTNETYGWMLCSVNQGRAAEFQHWISSHRPQDRVHLIQASEIPLASDVQSRETLGRDRLLAAWQARCMHPHGSLIIVDAGTAVTVDLVTADHLFAGGVIFPGARTMLQMLAHQTAALPDFSSLGIRGAFDRESLFQSAMERDFPAIGKSTQQAILMGVYQTQISAIRSIVAAQQSQSSATTVMTTGGGIAELQPWLPKDWIYEPRLVLRGVSALARAHWRDWIR